MRMLRRAVSLAWTIACLVPRAPAAAAEERALSFGEAIETARRSAPDIAVARGQENVAREEARILGVYPNPSVIGGTSTQAAKLSAGVSLPLVVFGQRGAAIDAGNAQYAVARVETELAWNDVRAGTGHAFVQLWLAERTAEARDDAAKVAKRLEDAVMTRVGVGSSPQMEGLRV